MRFQPYPFQQAGIEHASDFLQQSGPMEKQLYAAPTGCGKSVVELVLRERFPELWIVTPRDEIIAGMLDKMQLSDDEDSMEHRICTPVKLRNRLRDGKLTTPKQLVFDEGHHHEAASWQELDLLTGLAPSVAYTATPYRGTPKSTRSFLEAWGEPLWLITYEEAATEGYIRIPEFSVLPLVDDDIVDVRAGEFEVTSLEAATVNRLGDLADHCRAAYCPHGSWGLPTVFAVPSSRIAQELQDALHARSCPSAIVAAGTPKSHRAEIFRAVENCVLALIHINIVSEGVDLKLRRLVDLAPTLSPVKWVQQLGRITRPWDRTPEYVCTNRNILRHCYALEGVIPMGAVQKADRAFPSTERAHTRVLGLEAIGRFKPVAVRLTSGLTVHLYAMSVVLNNATAEYCCLVHPAMEPVWACKANIDNEEGQRTWGSWRECKPPTDLRGFASIGGKEVSPKQRAWWGRSAARFGLDPTQEVTRKSFQVLPLLNDLGVRLT